MYCDVVHMIAMMTVMEMCVGKVEAYVHSRGLMGDMESLEVELPQR